MAEKAESVLRFGIDFGGAIVQHIKDKPHEDTALTGIEGTEVIVSNAFEAIKVMDHHSYLCRMWRTYGL